MRPGAGPVSIHVPHSDGRTEYALVSDVHLTEVIRPPAPGWWEYKAVDAIQDEALAGLLRSLERRRPARFSRTEIVFNGDTFDFDAVFSAPPGVEAPPIGLPPSSEGSVYKMRRIIEDHPLFFDTLAWFLGRGNRATFVMGNHDRELTFPEVQEVLRQALAARAPIGTGEQVAAAVSVEPWFLYVPGVLYAEHGQQYDTTCSYRDVLSPVLPPSRRRPAEIESSFGSVMARYTLSRLGTFNPYNDESFIMSLGGYMRHFVKFYWPRRPLFRPFMAASVRALLDVRAMRRRARGSEAERQARYRAYGQAKGVDAGFIGVLERLSSSPIADRFRHLLHELWLDRFLIAVLGALILTVGVIAARTWTQGLLLLTLLPALTFVLRAMGRGSLALQERGRWGLVAEQIAGHLRVPVVAFGHSHRPERRPLAGGGRYYNLGTWAPVLDSERETTLARARRFLIVRPVAPDQVYVVFERWQEGDPLPY